MDKNVNTHSWLWKWRLCFSYEYSLIWDITWRLVLMGWFISSLKRCLYTHYHCAAWVCSRLCSVRRSFHPSQNLQGGSQGMSRHTGLCLSSFLSSFGHYFQWNHTGRMDTFFFFFHWEILTLWGKKKKKIQPHRPHLALLTFLHRAVPCSFFLPGHCCLLAEDDWFGGKLRLN